MPANLLLLNGRVHTLDAHRPLASAIAVRGNQILYVGDDATARDLSRGHPHTQVIDLHGRCVVPGLMDAHLHFQGFALGLQRVQAETATLAEALERVAQRAAQTPAGGWILGWGWNHNAWGGQFPTAAHLDGAAPNHPVCLSAKSGHAAWVNSKALALAKVGADTGNPPGGEIVRDAQGKPSGILLEEAMALVQRIIPQPTLEETVVAMRRALRAASRAGLTGVHDLDGPLAFAAEQVLLEHDELSLRVTKGIPAEHLEEAIALGLRSGFGGEWLRIGQVKFFADGALGPRTAWMLEGYDTAPEETGIPVTDPEALRRAAHQANAAGLGCAIHAIGDRAVRTALDIYATAPRPPDGKPPRNRIEHVQLVHPHDYGRLAALGVIASMQPIHATSDMLMANRHWGARCAGAYALKTMLQHGTILALGSDCPVEVIDPLVGIHAAVTRRRADGSPGPQGWYPEQRLTVAEAVRGFTLGPAHAAGLETRLGTIEAGKLADITILDQDIFAIDPMDILHTQVLGTLVGGRFAWRDETL